MTPKTKSYRIMSIETLQTITRSMVASSQDYKIASAILQEKGAPVLKNTFSEKKKATK